MIQRSETLELGYQPHARDLVAHRDDLEHHLRAGAGVASPERLGLPALAERLRADVAARRLTVAGRADGRRIELRCTVSCGVAATPGNNAVDRIGLLARADAALWRAKLAGRNRTVVDSGAEDGRGASR